MSDIIFNLTMPFPTQNSKTKNEQRSAARHLLHHLRRSTLVKTFCYAHTFTGLDHPWAY